MNIWANSWSDVRLHLNDFYMVMLMVGWMIVLSYFLITDHMGNTTVGLMVAILLIIIIIYAIRTQAFVNDKQ